MEKIHGLDTFKIIFFIFVNTGHTLKNTIANNGGDIGEI